jgi:HSP20 family protein
MRMGLDGLQAEPFGNVPPAAQTRGEKTAPATRAPITDIFEEGGEIRVIAEMPGVTEEDVICSIAGNSLRIETRGGHRYGKTLDLPGHIDPASLKFSCRNGIVEISITRAGGPA